MNALLAVVAVVLVGVLAMRLLRASRLVPVDDAERLHKLGGLLVDVRTREEFNHHHLPLARNIPLDQLKRRHAELGHGHLLVYAGDRGESAAAVKLLRAEGRTKVHDLGDMRRWRLAQG
jgi:rhodanese-related sulfurtransferase